MDVQAMTTATAQLSPRLWPSRLAGLLKGVLRVTRSAKRLRLRETLPLGERRFVAVVEFDRSRFLVGGTANTLVLLSRLADVEKEDEAVVDARPAGVTCAAERDGLC
jgi:hypothetical protein